MSLEGSLQTVALPEVLHLLADTSKSGELRVSGSRADGRLWFAAGELSGFQSGRCELAVDALFDLLRMDDGEFVFQAGVDRPEEAVRPGSGARPDDGGCADIRPLLEQAQARLLEWDEIVAVVPSLAHRVELVAEAPDGGVALDGPQWSMVVAIGEGRRVQEVLDRLQLPEFDGCKALQELVDEGVIQVVTLDAGKPDHDDELTAVDGDGAGVPASTASACGDELRDEPPTGNEAAPDVLTEHDSAPDDARKAVVETPAASADDQPDRPDDRPADRPADRANDGPDGRPDAPDAPDALADRGPWRAEELASLDPADWRDEEPAPSPGAHAGGSEQASNPYGRLAVAGSSTPDAQPDDHHGGDDAGDESSDPDGTEPINRGLLLKFLSSVRS